MGVTKWFGLGKTDDSLTVNGINGAVMSDA